MKKQISIRARIHEVIFGAETKAGKAFDIALLVLILFSVVAVMLESVREIREQHGLLLRWIEWIITILFTLEYLLRVYSINKPTKYIFSFMGIIDLLSTIPTYISLIVAGPQYLLTIRALRLLRVFRVLKLTRFVGEAALLKEALKASRYKISVFLLTVLITVVLVGTLLYIVEGPENGFKSIPLSIYWAIVTLTTVGYGDIAPQTPLGQIIASFVMVMGYGIIAVPTGIVTVAMSDAKKRVQSNTRSCSNCLADEHHDHALYCYNCGQEL
jgi:voltage-gated potassium channel